MNELAGGSHSRRSWHYQGTAVDLQVREGDPWEFWLRECRERGAVEALGPGDPGHNRHVHCAFPNVA